MCPSTVNKVIEKRSLCEENVGELTMVLCIVSGCGSKSGKHKGLGFFWIRKIITDQGEEYEELTLKRKDGKVDQCSKSWR